MLDMCLCHTSRVSSTRSLHTRRSQLRASPRDPLCCRRLDGDRDLFGENKENGKNRALTRFLVPWHLATLLRPTPWCCLRYGHAQFAAQLGRFFADFFRALAHVLLLMPLPLYLRLHGIELAGQVGDGVFRSLDLGRFQEQPDRTGP